MSHALELTDIRKRFGEIDALAGASIAVRHGSVHALFGENGAGKTTLMRVAFGMLRPDGGIVQIDGQRVTLRRPADAIARGIGMVHQHFTLVPAMTVAENVALGMHGRYDARRAAERIVALGRRTGLELEPSILAGDLSVGAQQRLEILKALARDARLLILDEPTAVLAPSEADELLRWVRRFCEEGHAAILITHKLREARTVADDVTVLRRGATVVSAPIGTLDEAALIRAMLGEGAADAPAADAPVLTSADVSGTTGGTNTTSSAYRSGITSAVRATRDSTSAGAPVLALRGASVDRADGAPALRDVTLEVRGGEILGVAAVEGSGQRELLRLLAGRLVPTRGAASLAPDVAWIPEDRHHDALVLDLTLVENVALRDLATRRGRMPWRALRTATETTLEQFDVRAAGIDAPARSLSGGNQQKLVFGRELGHRPAALVAENPTRGLDIRASAAVHRQLRAARDAGSAVVVCSGDLDEVLMLADRVIVVYNGGVREVAATRDAVGRAMLGAE